MSRIWFFLITLTLLFAAFGSRDTIASLDRAMIHAVGIDRENEGYRVTLQVFRPDGTGSETQLDPAKANVYTVDAAAPSVEQAIVLCEDKLGEYVFIGHCQVMLLGEGVSPEEPERLFAYFLRSKESYLGVRLAAAEGKASELLSAELSEGTVAAQNILNVIKRSAENGATVECDLLSVVNCGSCPPILPLLKKTGAPKEEQSSDEESSGPEGSSVPQLISVEGAVAFPKGKDPFRLGRGECAAISLVKGKAERLMLPAEDGEKPSAVSVEFSSCRTDARESGGVITVSKRLETVIRRDHTVDVLFRGEELEQRCQEELIALISSAERLSREKGCDLFGIGTTVRSRFPEVWRSCGGDTEELLRRCVLSFEAVCRVK